MQYILQGYNVNCLFQLLVELVQKFKDDIIHVVLVDVCDDPIYFDGFEEVIKYLEKTPMGHDFVASFELNSKTASFYVGVENTNISFGLPIFDHNGERIVRCKNSKRIDKSSILATEILQKLEFDEERKVSIFRENRDEDREVIFAGGASHVDNVGLLALISE